MDENKDNNSTEPNAVDKIADVGDKTSHFLFGVSKNKTPKTSGARPLLYLAAAILIPAVIILLAVI